MEENYYIVFLETAARLSRQQKLFRIIVGEIWKRSSSSVLTYVLFISVVSFYK